MTSDQTGGSGSAKPLRLWPGLAAGVVLVLIRFVVPMVALEAAFIGVMGALLCALAIVVWWTFFSRTPRFERWGAVVLMIGALAATPPILHESIATGMMGMMFFLYAIPVVSLVLVAWALAAGHLTVGPRRAVLAGAILLACGVWALLRTDGLLGGGGSEFAWRWSPTAEERLLVQASDRSPALPPAAVTAKTPGETPLMPDADIAPEPETGDEAAAIPATTAATEIPQERLMARAGEKTPTLPLALEAPEDGAEWPGFRGPNRDGVVRGVRIETDWSTAPPVELWRRPVGPGWSSFAVDGDLVYTQEQRGDNEVVSCYNLTTGEPVWMHRDAARFWESNAGAGPRATPTLSNGRVYTFGATGILNALDARNGSVVWSRNAASDTGATVPYWGFASSPLVVDDVVIIAAAGQLAAYDLATGDPRWTGPADGDSYSSPHPLTIDGVEQVLLMSAAGAISISPADGTVLWEHPWPGSTSLQPARTADGELLITTSGNTGGLGTRRLAVANGPGGWTTEERWTSTGLKPYFNDFVVHDGHAFGFDGRILSSIDLEDGQRKWKGGRYGNGQLVLLADQDLLLVLSDEGELALVGATPGQFTELARFPAIEGKTWNHPAMAGNVVLVRNSEEMAAFRLGAGG